MQKCERCEVLAEGYELLDYCVVCSKNLCDKCMQEGCCGEVPAISGMEADYPGDDDDSINEFDE